jgi:hypothetical protein
MRLSVSASCTSNNSVRARYMSHAHEIGHRVHRHHGSSLVSSICMLSARLMMQSPNVYDMHTKPAAYSAPSNKQLPMYTLKHNASKPPKLQPIDSLCTAKETPHLRQRHNRIGTLVCSAGAILCHTTYSSMQAKLYGRASGPPSSLPKATTELLP